MSTSRTDRRRADCERSVAGGKLEMETRIDAPHPPVETSARTPQDPATWEEAAAESGPPRKSAGGDLLPEVAEDATGLLRTQAAQLAEHLRQRQRELDQREAQVNARAAQVEREARAGELWWSQRLAELEERASRSDAPTSDQDAAVRHALAALAARERRLQQAETLCAAERAETEKLHAQLLADHRALDEESESRRQRWAAERQRVMAELEEKRCAVQRRGEQVDQARAALEQLRGELGRMQRETLEIRLATEELWVQLAGAAPPAALTRSLGRIRGQLAEHYRLASAELQQQKEELEKLRQALSEQYQKVARHKRQVEAWTGQCRQDTDQQAARLITRTHELDRREAELRETTRRWQSERLELQREIRRLQREPVLAE